MIPPVVDQAWVRAHPDVVLADVRWYLDGRSGERAFTEGHLPGAVFVDLDRWLAGPPSPQAGRHPLPDPAVFAQGMGAAGISDGDVVVAYDDAGGTVAARLVWMLRATGHDAAVLDGGLTAWDGPLTTTSPDRSPGSFTARPWPAERLADLDEVVTGAGVLVDARARARYRGEVEPVDPRAGHVPGAVNVPCGELMGADGRFLPPDELREVFADVGVVDAADVVAYCGSGVTACHVLVALEHTGLGTARLFPGSWSRYSSDPTLPAATGPQPR
ncbi:sulfurtransferase [Cellulomonas bogoriensis]|uniref:Sulfurtransferase n=1 Tax=Cellulomonas bogoriensis 69B4 = DSM 16987 TaxID=1386082 RepID=A0A0A0BWI1_9CELL|nr:sulfurtransferase [Cellulomonas bogoriensis]KGM12325.1 sulfurtransferase [Cellulomonas bogoriensis 69B4 = DSM 16987]